MRLYLLSAILLLTTSVQSQDLSGIWQGKLTQEPGGCFPEYYIELQIQAGDNGITGISYDYYDTSQYVKLNFSGVYATKGNKKVLITEKAVLKQQIPDDCTPCLKMYNLSYSRQNNVESLSGEWEGEDMGTLMGCPPGFIFLHKVDKSAFEEKVVRKTELATICEVDSPNVQIDFYDNGTIDGDSISVLLDNQVQLSRQALSLTPVSINLTLQPEREYNLTILAESLGSIPPNTALIVVTSGGKKHEILVSTTEKSNASLKIIYTNKLKVSSK